GLICRWIIFLLMISREFEALRKFITAESGQNVTLTCLVPTTSTIRVVKWSRADRGNQYVLLYQDGLFVPDDQDPSFKNRVELRDRQMKDGDVSLILKNVTFNDAGIYECRSPQTSSEQLFRFDGNRNNSFEVCL
uniref:Ig-like domain-containing protein n=1 Tax=Amphilophus citrinellus TaxID=61819 RepID=A0A3Q0S911_AMPCI